MSRPTLIDQVSVDHGVEARVVVNVIDVPIHVVGVPACWYIADEPRYVPARKA
jgi:hypothetical protein